jgi:hypothetical protein
MNTKLSITAALAAAGLITCATSASAQCAGAPLGTGNNVYLTGSTAFRSVVFAALSNGKQAGGACAGALGTVFDTVGNNGALANPITMGFSGGVTHTPATGSDNTVIFEGYIGGALYDIVCSWTGSEAGIACVAGTTIANIRVPAHWNPDGSPSVQSTLKNLPGAPTKFLDKNAGPPYSALEAATRQGDLSMADTSIASSLNSGAALTEYGAVGIVPFTYVKGKNSAPDASWTDLVNVSHSQLLSFMAGTKPAAYFTGVVTDTDTCYLVGRNKGSGTRVNTMLDTTFFPSSPQQYSVQAWYDTNGVLNFTGNGTLAAPGNPSPMTNAPEQNPTGDGMDSGGFVAQEAQCDGLFNTNGIVIAYLGIGDAVTARDGKGNAANPGGAVWLTLDGTAESNGAVQEGKYSYWGHEHLYGQVTPSVSADTVAKALNGTTTGGVPAAIVNHGVAAQDTGIGIGAMHCDKPSSGDSGWPTR